MAPRITVKWSIVVTYRVATLEPQGVVSGTLDPVIGVAPMDQVAIGYGDVVAVAVWRRIAWPELLAGVLLPAPIAAFCEYVALLAAMHSHDAVPTAIFAGIGLLFGALAVWLVYRGAVVGRRQARITGRYHQVIVVPFDKSPAFYEQLFRRMGLEPPPIP